MFHLNDRLFAVDAVLFQLVREHALDRLREKCYVTTLTFNWTS